MPIVLDLIPMMLGSALAPIWIILVLLILKTPKGFGKAIAFVAGMTLVRLGQGVMGGVILRQAKLAEPNDAAPILATLLTLLGLFLLIAAVKKLVKEEDVDAPPPKWMTTFDRATPLTILGMGALGTLIAPKLWIFTLSAISTIVSTNPAIATAIQLYLLYILGAQFLLCLPLVAYAIAPRQSATRLNAASDWLMKYNKPITVVVSTVFGIIFLTQGLTGLMA